MVGLLIGADVMNKKTRAVLKHPQVVCKYLNLDGVESHSFRKGFATNVYVNNHHDLGNTDGSNGPIHGILCAIDKVSGIREVIINEDCDIF